jgi:hypothetical protein
VPAALALAWALGEWLSPFTFGFGDPPPPLTGEAEAEDLRVLCAAVGRPDDADPDEEGGGDKLCAVAGGVNKCPGPLLLLLVLLAQFSGVAVVADVVVAPCA